MISRTFVFEIEQEPEHYFAKAQTIAATAGAKLLGEPMSGTFSHRGVRGVYKVENGLISIDLDKPIGVPWGPMKRAMESFFDQPASTSPPVRSQP